jgi:hypothetical protein
MKDKEFEDLFIRHIECFTLDDLDQTSFLEGLNTITKEWLKKGHFKEANYDKIPIDLQEHEQKHMEKIKQYGLQGLYHKKCGLRGIFFPHVYTSPCDWTALSTWDKNKILRLMYDWISAPYSSGKYEESFNTKSPFDKKLLDILSRYVQSSSRMCEDSLDVASKYALPKIAAA